MEEKRLPASKSGFFHINRRLLPFKLHFFFVCGGYSGLLPFMPIIAKNIGINSTAFGIGYSVIPIFVFLCNPFFGFLVDYFQTIKTFLIVFIITSSISFASVLTLPTITYEELEDATYVRILNYNDSKHVLNISTPFDGFCLDAVLKENIQCELRLEYGNLTVFRDTNATEDLISIGYNASDIVKDGFNKHMKTFYTRYYFPLEVNESVNTVKSFRCLPSIHQCSLTGSTNFVYSTYQYWMFFTFVVLGVISSSSAMSLSSVACYEILGTEIEVYGRQRLMGTIGWGLICPLAGSLNDAMSSTEKTFLPGFFIMAAVLAVDIVILSVIYIPKANISKSMNKDLLTMLSSVEILLFALGVSLVGVFSTIISVYEFWFLEDMGANRTLLGLAIFMQCLVGELPCLYFSGWFVKKLGHYLCFASVFAAFALRLLLYSYIKDPWLVLPIDILHGVTFGVYHGAMTSFAKVKAKKGMEATLLGFFSGLSEGLGYGLGSLLGGLGLDKLGARKTFFTASMFSMGCLLIFQVASRKFRTTKKKETTTLEIDDFVENK